MTNEQDMLPFGSREMTDAQWRQRIAALLNTVAWQSRPCKACQRMIWFTRNKSGAIGVWTDDGISHFANCPHAERFKKAEP